MISCRLALCASQVLLCRLSQCNTSCAVVAKAYHDTPQCMCRREFTPVIEPQGRAHLHCGLWRATFWVGWVGLCSENGVDVHCGALQSGVSIVVYPRRTPQSRVESCE